MTVNYYFISGATVCMVVRLCYLRISGSIYTGAEYHKLSLSAPWYFEHNCCQAEIHGIVHCIVWKEKVLQLF